MNHKTVLVCFALIITVLLSSCSLFLEAPVGSSDVSDSVFESTEEPYVGPSRAPFTTVYDIGGSNADGVRMLRATDGVITISYQAESTGSFKANGTVEVILTDPTEHLYTDMFFIYASIDRTVVTVKSHDLVLIFDDGTEETVSSYGDVYHCIDEKQNATAWELNIKEAIGESRSPVSAKLIMGIEFSVKNGILLTTVPTIILNYEYVLNPDAYGEIGLVGGTMGIGLKNGGKNNSLVRSAYILSGVRLAPDAG